MRNLKRALSLAVASVMLVGMMVVGTSASYNDVSTDYNQEAIEVLQAIKVMVGDDNGNFNPTAAVTRNEMAVIMSNLMDYRVATYAGTAPFTDVPTWAEPYVAACYTNGITAGIGNGLYGGSNTVTTAEAALMMMKALGYFQYASDFGDDWQLATTKQANKIELLDGLEAGVKETLTRNDVAQLVLNTLKSGMVEADDDTIKVITDNATVEAGSVKYSYVVSGKSYAYAINDEDYAVSATTTSTQGSIVQLGEKLYQGDLKLDDDNVNEAFGRPAVKWTYKLDEIGTYADDTLATYTAKVTKGTLYSLIGSSNISKLTYNAALAEDSLVLYVDGDKVNVGETDLFVRNSSAAVADVAGKGVLTEVYQDDDNNITIVIINTYLAQATGDYNKDKGDVSIDVITGDANENALEDDDFDIADIKEDDYILYTYANGEIQDIQVAKVVTGEVNAYSVTNYVKIDGTQYDYAKKIETEDSKPTEYVVGDTASIVLDAYGYVIYVDDASISVGNYVYIDAACKKSGLSSTKIADAYFSDGRNEEITIKSIVDENKNDIAINSVNGSDFHEQGWYSYTKNSEGKYKLTKAATSEIATGVTEITNGKTSIGGKVAGNSETIFVLNDDGDISVYTGITNVPTIKTKDGGPANFSIAYMKANDKDSKAARLVYVDVTDLKVENAGVDSLVYILKYDKAYVDTSDNEKVYVYIALVDGVITTIESKDASGGASEVGNFYTDYSIDSDGYYELDGDAFANDTDQAIINLAGANLTYSKGTLMITGATTSNSNVDVDNGNIYVTLSDTKIVAILRPVPASNGTLENNIMKDESADYEVRSLTGSSLASLFKGYDITGTISIIYADDIVDSDVAATVYVEVTSVVETA